MNKKILIVVTLVLTLIAGIFVVNKIMGYVIKSQIPETDWLAENCNCTEKERLKCPEGFKIQGGICRKGEIWTNPLRKCSLYECPENKTYEIN